MIVLDTHVLVWLANEPAKLSKNASEAIRSSIGQGGLAISAISLWELSWLATHRRLRIAGTVESFLEKISRVRQFCQSRRKLPLLPTNFPLPFHETRATASLGQPRSLKGSLWSLRTA